MRADGEKPREVIAGPGDDTFPLVFWSPMGAGYLFNGGTIPRSRTAPRASSIDSMNTATIQLS